MAGRDPALESLIDRADVVFCQIDGISHHTCLEAKHLCRRLAKPLALQRASSFRRGGASPRIMMQTWVVAVASA
jgi:hypothetical protein